MYDFLTYPHMKIYFIDGPHRESYAKKKKTIFSGGPLKWMHESIYFRRKDSGWFIQKFELPPHSIFNTWIFFNSSPLSPYVILISSPHTPLSLSLPAGRVAVAGVRVVKATRDDGSRGRREHNEGGEGRGVWRWPFPARIWRWQREEHDLGGGNGGC